VPSIAAANGRREIYTQLSNKPKRRAEINMIPFIDVVLVLPIIFMITADSAVRHRSRRPQD
jgi:biopolymer transport protein ExbD